MELDLFKLLLERLPEIGLSIIFLILYFLERRRGLELADKFVCVVKDNSQINRDVLSTISNNTRVLELLTVKMESTLDVIENLVSGESKLANGRAALAAKNMKGLSDQIDHLDDKRRIK